MLAVDTNLIVRYLVGDDPVQAVQARKVIDRNDVFISSTVMLETEWVLRSAYGFRARQCVEAMQRLAGLSNVTLDDPTAVAKALDWAGQGIDFADALHLAKGADCEALVTFDRDLIKAAERLGLKARTPQ